MYALTHERNLFMASETSIKLKPGDLFGGNSDAKLALAFLLDCSGSMEGEPIEQVNQGIQFFTDFIKANPIAKHRLDTTIISFGETVTVEQQNISATDLVAPQLKADGETPLGEAILTALEILEQQKQYYKAEDIEYIKPIIICLTDGQPTDEETFKDAVNELLIMEAKNNVSFYCIGCNGADMSVMESMNTKHKPMSMHTLDITKFFKTVSAVVSGGVGRDGQINLHEVQSRYAH